MAVANTILAGAQKSGTTALCRFLGEHPQCFISDPKETNFFSRAENAAFMEQYARFFREARPHHRVLIDGTTTYMSDPAIAQRIRDCLGENPRFIFVLRRPSARAYSGFLHMVKRGHERRSADAVFLSLPDDPEDARALEDAAVREAAARGQVSERPYRNLYDDALWNYRYVGNSLYSSLVRNYTNLFGAERVLVLFFEDLTRDVLPSRDVLGEFLGVEPSGFPDRLPESNRTQLPNLSSLGGRLFEQARWLKRGNYTLVRPREIGASPAKPSPEVSAKLERIFRGEVAHWKRWADADDASETSPEMTVRREAAAATGAAGD